MITTSPIIRSDSDEPEAGDELIAQEALNTLPELERKLVFVLDQVSRRFLKLSGACEEFFNLTREQMLADPRAWLQSLEPLDRAAANTLAEDLNRRGNIVRVVHAIGRDGVKRTLRVSLVRRQVGGRTLVAGSVLEIEPSSGHGVSSVLSAAVEAAHDGVAVTDAEGCYLFLNREHVTLFGYETMNELIGKSWRVLYSDEVVRHFEQVVFPELVANGRWRGRLQAKRKDGSFFQEGISLSLLSGGGLVCNCQDVSAQVQMEAELAEIARRREEYLLMQREFISMVSHEFRTPLTAIQGLQYLMQKSVSGATEPSLAGFNRWLGLQGQALGTLKELVDQVLLLTRIEHLASVAPQRVALGTFLAKIVEGIATSLGNNRLKLQLDLPGGFTALLDEPHLRALVENLVSNGLKYSSETVTVQVGADGNHWWLSVEDRGRGIPQKDQANLFRPFFRASNIANVPGTGLGLTIVQRCATFHGGTVELESREGVGSKFTAKFPLTFPQQQPARPYLEPGRSLDPFSKFAQS